MCSSFISFSIFTLALRRKKNLEKKGKKKQWTRKQRAKQNKISGIVFIGLIKLNIDNNILNHHSRSSSISSALNNHQSSINIDNHQPNLQFAFDSIGSFSFEVPISSMFVSSNPPSLMFLAATLNLAKVSSSLNNPDFSMIKTLTCHQ